MVEGVKFRYTGKCILNKKFFISVLKCSVVSFCVSGNSLLYRFRGVEFFG